MVTHATEVVVHSDQDEIPVGVDGESLTFRTPVQCTIAPRALRVQVPRVRPGMRPVRPTIDLSRLYRLTGMPVRFTLA